jgi:hypothetical protein
MRRLIVATAVFASLATTAQANDVLDLSLKGQPVSTKQAEAPFVAKRDPLPFILMQEEQERRGFQGSCEAAARDLCFDAASGRVVYRAARKYMPQFEGLQPESVSLRGNRVTFKYSFK